jgi:hypothetical protein
MVQKMTNLLPELGQLANNHGLKIHMWAFVARNNHLVGRLEDWLWLGAENQEVSPQTTLRWDLRYRIQYR